MDYETLYVKTNVAVNNQLYFRTSKIFFYSFMHDCEISLYNQMKRKLKQETNHLIGSQIYLKTYDSIKRKLAVHLKTYEF